MAAINRKKAGSQWQAENGGVMAKIVALKYRGGVTNESQQWRRRKCRRRMWRINGVMAAIGVAAASKAAAAKANGFSEKQWR
jgi:hypothetical protein